MTYLLDLIYALALVLYSPALLVRRWRRGPGSLALGERFGNVPSRPVSGRCVWLHAVSLGEVNATRTIVATLRQRYPDVSIAISSTTKTGLTRARELYPDLTVFRYPLDFSFAIRRVLARVRPTVLVLMELEVWPNLIELLHQRQIPLLVANGRLTEQRSMRGFRLPVVRNVARRMFRRLSWVGAQDHANAERFIALGAPRECVHVIGSLKYDTADTADAIPGQRALAEEMGIAADPPLWVCGSTGPGEEALILDAFAELRAKAVALQLAIVPRKPERFDEVARLIVSRGYACLRRSTGKPLLPSDNPAAPAVFLGDTLGELRKFYGLARIVFVGRSLVPMGGSDMLEVAALGKPFLIGPHTENFAEAVRNLLSAKACRKVTSVEALAGGIAQLLRHPNEAAAMGAAGRECIRTRQGATVRTVDAIAQRLGME